MSLNEWASARTSLAAPSACKRMPGANGSTLCMSVVRRRSGANARRTSSTLAPIVARTPARSTSSSRVWTGVLTVAGPNASARDAVSMSAEFTNTTRHASEISLLGVRGTGRLAPDEMWAVITPQDDAVLIRRAKALRAAVAAPWGPRPLLRKRGSRTHVDRCAAESFSNGPSTV